jgi:hypothetical protein
MHGNLKSAQGLPKKRIVRKFKTNCAINFPGSTGEGKSSDEGNQV